MENIFKLFSFLICITSSSQTILEKKEKTLCNFLESVNITGAKIFANGSAIFEGQEYLNGSYGDFNDSLFESVDAANKNKTHLRGCICDLEGSKPCLPFCCPEGFIKNSKHGLLCFSYVDNDFKMNTSNKENPKQITVKDNYKIVQGDSCGEDFYQYHVFNSEKWELFEVSLLVNKSNSILKEPYLERHTVF